MKQIKWIFFVLYIAGYTSLIWATVLWNGLQVGPNNAPIGLVLSIALTIIHIILIVRYLFNHWNDDAM